MSASPAVVEARLSEPIEGFNAQTRLRPGTRVDVRVRFDGSWSRGFEVDSVENGCYVIRRISDGSVLPVLFPADEIHPGN